MDLPSWTRFEGDIGTNLKSRANWGALISVSSGIVRMVTRIITVVVLGRLLTPEDYGLVGMITPIITFITVFSDGGVSQYTLQSRNITQQAMSLTFWIGAGFCVLAFLAVLLSAPVLSLLYREPDITLLMSVAGLSILISIFHAQHVALLKRCLKQGILAFSEIVGAVAGCVLGIWAALEGYGCWSLVVVILARGIGQVVVVWALTRWVPSLPVWDSEQGREILKFGGLFTFSSALGSLCRDSDKILLGIFYSAEELGYYAIAHMILMFPLLQVLTPIAGAVVPYFSMLRDSREAFEKEINEVIVVLGSVTVPFMVFAAAKSGALITLIFGEKWLPSAPVFSFLAIAGANLIFLYPMNWALHADGQAGKMARLSIYSTINTAVGYVAGLPWGGVGIAFCYALNSVIYLVFFTRLHATYMGLSHSTFLLAVAKVYLSSILTVACLYGIDIHLLRDLKGVPMLVFYFFGIVALMPLYLYVTRVDLQVFEKFFSFMRRKRRRPAVL